MDSLNYVKAECKCFIVGCNNSAAIYARIELNDRVDALIRVFHSCLPVIQIDQIDKEQEVKQTAPATEQVNNNGSDSDEEGGRRF